METKTLTFVKDGHRYVFRYTQAGRRQVVAEIMRLAETNRLTWAEAAQLGAQVASQALNGRQRTASALAAMRTRANEPVRCAVGRPRRPRAWRAA